MSQANPIAGQSQLPPFTTYIVVSVVVIACCTAIALGILSCLSALPRMPAGINAFISYIPIPVGVLFIALGTIGVVSTVLELKDLHASTRQSPDSVESTEPTPIQPPSQEAETVAPPAEKPKEVAHTNDAMACFKGSSTVDFATARLDVEGIWKLLQLRYGESLPDGALDELNKLNAVIAPHCPPDSNPLNMVGVKDGELDVFNINGRLSYIDGDKMTYPKPGMWELCHLNILAQSDNKFLSTYFKVILEKLEYSLLRLQPLQDKEIKLAKRAATVAGQFTPETRLKDLRQFDSASLYRLCIANQELHEKNPNVRLREYFGFLMFLTPHQVVDLLDYMRVNGLSFSVISNPIEFLFPTHFCKERPSYIQATLQMLPIATLQHHQEFFSQSCDFTLLTTLFSAAQKNDPSYPWETKNIIL